MVFIRAVATAIISDKERRENKTETFLHLQCIQFGLINFQRRVPCVQMI